MTNPRCRRRRASRVRSALELWQSNTGHHWFQHPEPFDAGSTNDMVAVTVGPSPETSARGSDSPVGGPFAPIELTVDVRAIVDDQGVLAEMDQENP